MIVRVLVLVCVHARYAVEWSAADPWIFASLSYDGRLVVNKVPKSIKYQILL